jgi:hypothetical protein
MEARWELAWKREQLASFGAAFTGTEALRSYSGVLRIRCRADASLTGSSYLHQVRKYIYT